MKAKDKPWLILVFAVMTVIVMENFSIVLGSSTNDGGSSSNVSSTTKNGIQSTTRNVGRQTMDTARTTFCPEHTCKDDKKCYTHDQQCDGFQDCDDNTDEDIGLCK